MMYKEGLRVLVFYNLGKTVQGEEIVIYKERLWRRQTFLGGAHQKSQWSSCNERNSNCMKGSWGLLD